MLLLFPFPADSLLSGSLPDCSAKVTESTAFSTSWILASFLAVAVGFFPGSFVVVFWAISCPGPSLEGPPPSSWVFLLFTVSFFDSFYSFILFFGISIFMKSTTQRLEVPLSIGISNLVDLRACIRAVVVSGFAEISLSSL